MNKKWIMEVEWYLDETWANKHGIWGQTKVNRGIVVILSSLIKTLRFGKAKRNVLIGSQPMEQ
jgi:hypothetical protein